MANFPDPILLVAGGQDATVPQPTRSARDQELATVCYTHRMSKLLEQVFEKVRELPEPEQDMAATELLGFLADFPTATERIVIGSGREAYERGETVTLDQWRHDMELGDR